MRFAFVHMLPVFKLVLICIFFLCRGKLFNAFGMDWMDGLDAGKDRMVP